MIEARKPASTGSKNNMPFYRQFDLDIVSALRDQLIRAFSELQPGPLNQKNIGTVPDEAGVYQLYHVHGVVYVGKTDDLRKRLKEHREKISGRRNIRLTDVAFTCLSVRSNIHAVSESSLIKHYTSIPGACSWNGNGFGPHDPGRRREETNKPPDGFDAQFPIRDDWPLAGIKPGHWNCNELLQALKSQLPYLLRYESKTKNRLKEGHPDYNRKVVHVPRRGMAARDLLRLIAQNLPGWQATSFPSHLILYQERRRYEHGTVIWPEK